MQKKKAAAVAAVSALVIGVSASVYAYFTDRTGVTNTFTVGSVEIEIEEPHWPGNDTPDTTTLYPGETIPKDPTVTNVGKNPGYVRQEILIPVGDVTVFDAQTGTKALKNAELVTYEITDKWKEDTGYAGLVTKDGRAYSRHVYYYEDVVEPEGTTTPLFESITLINLIEGQIPADTVQNLPITANAIQSQGFESAAEAWKAYDIQNGNVTPETETPKETEAPKETEPSAQE